MAKYLIDHKHKRIHRSAFVGDKCDLPQIPLNKRTGEDFEEKINILMVKGYEYCQFCYDGPPLLVNEVHE
ncbi:hypothetical protein [Pseudalkalibacillus berkeleyi]|uniref:Uncharacterized protein n=1 Tax=Pseudalkalibacillus berkeleyi TaxID=1069813 RepID=A0ABS9H5Z8_9BACL|nr:hypothetical protein [Pseudalkalibacillus berkeleyi]MCF6139220.1 hypothetical protein [Pseudalkalibacillus berkeleyi]